MRLVLKLLPLVALFAFGAFTVGLPKAAQANLGTLSVSATTAPIGQPVTLTASLSNIASANVTLSATNSDFLAGSVSTGESVSGIGTTALSFTGAGSTAAATFTALWSCQYTGSVTFILSQNPSPSSGSGFLTATILCTDVAASTLTVTPSTQSAGLPASVTGTCASAGQPLTAVGPGAFSIYPAPSNITVTAPTSVTCVAAGLFSVSYICGFQGTVTFSLGGVITTLDCTGGVNPYSPTQVCPTYPGAVPYGYNAYYQNSCSIATGASEVTATTSSGSVSCGGTAFVTVVVRDSSGVYVLNGQPVTLTATMGTISPSTAMTQGGSILATYQAPSTGSGTATIAIAAGTASTTTTINVDCTPVVPQPAPVASAPVLIPPSSLITPPRTGDAGLLADIMGCDD